MQDDEFSDDFCGFIQTSLPTLDAAELMLALHGEPGVWWQPTDLASKLQSTVNMTQTEAARYLEMFHIRGLLEKDPDRGYQYRPVSDRLAAHVRKLEQAYKERPVTLIRVIYALRDLKIQSFADAFKLRRKSPCWDRVCKIHSNHFEVRIIAKIRNPYAGCP